MRNGKFWLRLSAQPDGKTRRQRRLGPFESEQEALERQAALAPLGSAKSLTVGDWLDRFLTVRRDLLLAGNRQARYAELEQHIRTWLKPQLGRMLLAELLASDCEALWATMLNAGRSHKTVVNVRSTLVHALKAAQKDRLITDNAASLSDIPKKHQASKTTAESVAERVLHGDVLSQLEDWALAGITTETWGNGVPAGTRHRRAPRRDRGCALGRHRLRDRQDANPSAGDNRESWASRSSPSSVQSRHNNRSGRSNCRLGLSKRFGNTETLTTTHRARPRIPPPRQTPEPRLLDELGRPNLAQEPWTQPTLPTRLPAHPQPHTCSQQASTSSKYHDASATSAPPSHSTSTDTPFPPKTPRPPQHGNGFGLVERANTVSTATEQLAQRVAYTSDLVPCQETFARSATRC